VDKNGDRILNIMLMIAKKGLVKRSSF